MAQLSLSLATSSLNPSHISSKDGKGDSGDWPAATSAVQEDETGSITLSPLGKACSRMDFLSIHEILEKVGYKDDKGTTNKLLFQQWTNQNEEILECKKRGDNAFRSKDYLSAINDYSLV